MTAARSVGEALGFSKTTKARRTFQPVRRNSFNIGEREARYWRPSPPAQMQAIVEAAELHDDIGKEGGKRNGPLGYVALKVLRYLAKRVDWKTGRLEPAIDTIARAVKLARSAVISALARLKAQGFLEWMRRTEVIEDAEGPGPRVRQVSNAYRLVPPASWAKRIGMRAAELVGRKRGPQPAPAPAAEPKPWSGPVAEAVSKLEASLQSRSASPSNGQNPGHHSKG
jgi:hypothetical protein